MADLNIGNSSTNVVVNAKHNGSVTPQINNTYDLGTSALRWKNIYGSLKGNADSATKLATARTISLTGSVTGSGTFDGSGNLSIATTTNHTHNYAGSSSAGGPANSVKTNLIIKLNGGTNEGNNLFTFNGSAAKTINITPSAIGASASGHTHAAATTSANGFMSSDDKAKLDGITASADAVSFSRSLTSGTKVGTITINGTGTDLYAPTNTDTHWTTGITAGETGTTSNSATTNGNTFIKIKDNSTHRGQIKIIGSGATSVSSDANGVITISSTDNNTTYGSMSVDEGTTGTATTNRVLTAANLKGIINAHAPTKTGGGASGTWGISITGNAATATKLSGSEFTTDTIDNVTHSGLLYGTIGSYTGPGFSSNDAMILSMSWNSSNNYGAQIALDDSTTPNMYVRNKGSGSWSSWSKVLLSTNYTDYTVKKDGTGASGTWGISISGNAAKVNNKLTVGSKTYDGSSAVTIEASDLGLASAMLFLGTTTTAITDGATTNPVVLGGSNKTVTAGNVVLYGSKEFVWTGRAWEELGNEGSYKIVQAAVADPSASGTSNTFIDTISQDTNGKITATKKTVAVTNSAPTLAWSTTSTIGTVAGTSLQVKMPANPNTDTKVTQTAINATDYTNWRPLIWGSSNSGTEGFTPSTLTDGVYTAQTLSCQPSTGTIRATTFKGSLSGNATTATKLATARTIRTNLASTSAASFDGSGNITPGVTGTLPIANGGTGATTASAARNNLGAQSKVLYGPSAPSDSTGSNGDMYIALENGDFKKDIVDLIYPVGSIYISMNSTNPSTLFGGTWVQIKDKFLLSAGDTYKVGATGGEATHTLTKSEIPNYKIGDIPEAVPYMHDNWRNGGITGGDLGNASSSKKGVSNNNDVLTITSGKQWSYKISTNGGGQPHNNMPPYIAVYMWKRTA